MLPPPSATSPPATSPPATARRWYHHSTTALQACHSVLWVKQTLVVPRCQDCSRSGLAVASIEGVHRVDPRVPGGGLGSGRHSVELLERHPSREVGGHPRVQGLVTIRAGEQGVRCIVSKRLGIHIKMFLISTNVSFLIPKSCIYTLQ